MKRFSFFSLLLACIISFSGCDATTVKEQTTDIAEEAYITEDVQIADWNAALDRLKSGNERFVNDNSQLINITSTRRDQLKDGQYPYAVVVSCSDSRVTPELVFNAGLGEIFDIRLAGNVVDKDALGSIEYGVEHLHCPLIVVMGHEKCGAVTAAYEKLKNGTQAEGNMASFVNKILPAIKDADSLDTAIHENIDEVFDEVCDDEIVEKLINDGKINVVKAYYSLDGIITFY